jgi:hypothetical protein
MESEQKTQSKLFSWTKSTVQTWKSNEEILFFSKNKLEILHSGYTKPEKKKEFCWHAKTKKDQQPFIQFKQEMYNTQTPTKWWL